MTQSTAPKDAPRPRPSRWRRLFKAKADTGPMPLAEPGELEAWLSAWLAPRLGLAAADVDRLKPFHEYGLDSLVAVELSGRLEQLLGRPVSPSAAWEHPTINGLSEYLRSGQEPEFIDMDLQA